MPWHELLGHADAIEQLRGAAARGRLAHTLLFTGPAGIGKKRFALLFAECLFCDRHSEEELLACGECSGCKQVRARSHPDLIVVERKTGKSSLLIEQFVGDSEHRGQEGLCHELALRAMSGRRKIAIIDEAELLGIESANALLKTLEEPPERSIIILLAVSPDLLLPTIRSRCQVVRFAPLSDDQVRELLTREELCDNPQDAAEIAGLCEGSLETARQLLDPQLRAQRGTLYNLLAARPFNSVQTTHGVLEGVQQAGTESFEQRQYAGWIIRFCSEFYRRALYALSSGNGAACVIPQVQQFAAHLNPDEPSDIDRVTDLLDRCLEADRQIDMNASIPLCLESLFDDLGRLQRS
jgi:DNA polymerase III subunit delta'